jgi:hypothetical protein
MISRTSRIRCFKTHFHVIIYFKQKKDLTTHSSVKIIYIRNRSLFKGKTQLMQFMPIYLGAGSFKVALTIMNCFISYFLYSMGKVIVVHSSSACGREIYVASARTFLSNVPLWLEQRYDP